MHPPRAAPSQSAHGRFGRNVELAPVPHAWPIDLQTVSYGSLFIPHDILLVSRGSVFLYALNPLKLTTHPPNPKLKIPVCIKRRELCAGQIARFSFGKWLLNKRLRNFQIKPTRTNNLPLFMNMFLL